MEKEAEVSAQVCQGKEGRSCDSTYFVRATAYRLRLIGKDQWLNHECVSISKVNRDVIKKGKKYIPACITLASHLSPLHCNIVLELVQVSSPSNALPSEPCPTSALVVALLLDTVGSEASNGWRSRSVLIAIEVVLLLDVETD